MKKMFMILAAGLLCVSMAGCGGDKAAESAEKAQEAAAEVKEEAEKKAEKIEEKAEEAAELKEEEALAEAMSDGEEAEEELEGDIAEAETVPAEAGSGTENGVLVYGDFTATIRYLMPDYVLDGDTMQVAVVTLFQDSPFAIYLGYEKADGLQVGETYTFEIEETEVFGESDDELSYIDPSYFLREHLISIKSIRPAAEDETGLVCNRLAYTKLG